jgi:hypothetical protein
MSVRVRLNLSIFGVPSLLANDSGLTESRRTTSALAIPCPSAAAGRSPCTRHHRRFEPENLGRHRLFLQGTSCANCPGDSLGSIYPLDDRFVARRFLVEGCFSKPYRGLDQLSVLPDYNTLTETSPSIRIECVSATMSAASPHNSIFYEARSDACAFFLNR